MIKKNEINIKAHMLRAGSGVYRPVRKSTISSMQMSLFRHLSSNGDQREPKRRDHSQRLIRLINSQRLHRTIGLISCVDRSRFDRDRA